MLMGTLGWAIGTSQGMALGRDFWFVLGWMGVAGLVIAMCWLLASTPVGAIKLKRRVSAVVILVGAAVLQVVAVVWVPPVVSEDLVRYRTDGRLLLAGESPYVVTPLRWWAEGGTDAVDDLVAHQAVASVYPPVAQGVFAASVAVERAVAVLEPGRTLEAGRNYAQWMSEAPWYERFVVLRGVMAAAAVGATALLLWLVGRAGHSPWWAVVFGWNPLVVMECGGQGHVDVVGVALLLGAVVAGVKRWPVLAGAMVVAAAGVKPQAILMLPVVWAAMGGMRWRVVAGAAVVGGVLALPMLAGGAWQAYVANVAVFSRSWEANGSVYELVVRWAAWGDEIGDITQAAKDWARAGASVVTLGTLAVVTALVARGRLTMVAGMYGVLMVLLLSGSVLYPWYLLWPLALVPLMGGRGGMAAVLWSGTVAISYLLWRYDDWRLPGWLVLLQYGPVYAVAATELWGWWRGKSMPDGSEPGHEAAA